MYFSHAISYHHSKCVLSYRNRCFVMFNFGTPHISVGVYLHSVLPKVSVEVRACMLPGQHNHTKCDHGHLTHIFTRSPAARSKPGKITGWIQGVNATRSCSLPCSPMHRSHAAPMHPSHGVPCVLTRQPHAPNPCDLMRPHASRSRFCRFMWA